MVRKSFDERYGGFNRIFSAPVESGRGAASPETKRPIPQPEINAADNENTRFDIQRKAVYSQLPDYPSRYKLSVAEDALQPDTINYLNALHELVLRESDIEKSNKILSDNERKALQTRPLLYAAHARLKKQILDFPISTPPSETSTKTIEEQLIKIQKTAAKILEYQNIINVSLTIKGSTAPDVGHFVVATQTTETPKNVMDAAVPPVIPDAVAREVVTQDPHAIYAQQFKEANLGTGFNETVEKLQRQQRKLVYVLYHKDAGMFRHDDLSPKAEMLYEVLMRIKNDEHTEANLLEEMLSRYFSIKENENPQLVQELVQKRQEYRKSFEGLKVAAAALLAAPIPEDVESSEDDKKLEPLVLTPDLRIAPEVTAVSTKDVPVPIDSDIALEIPSSDTPLDLERLQQRPFAVEQPNTPFVWQGENYDAGLAALEVERAKNVSDKLPALEQIRKDTSSRWHRRVGNALLAAAVGLYSAGLYNDLTTDWSANRGPEVKTKIPEVVPQTDMSAQDIATAEHIKGLQKQVAAQFAASTEVLPTPSAAEHTPSIDQTTAPWPAAMTQTPFATTAQATERGNEITLPGSDEPIITSNLETLPVSPTFDTPPQSLSEAIAITLQMYAPTQKQLSARPEGTPTLSSSIDQSITTPSESILSQLSAVDVLPTIRLSTAEATTTVAQFERLTPIPFILTKDYPTVSEAAYKMWRENHNLITKRVTYDKFLLAMWAADEYLKNNPTIHAAVAKSMGIESGDINKVNLKEINLAAYMRVVDKFTN